MTHPQCFDPAGCFYPNGRCVEPTRCEAPKADRAADRATTTPVDHGMTYRPTQDEVEAKAAELFGERWKGVYLDGIHVNEAEIARHLDLARAAVMEARDDG